MIQPYQGHTPQLGENVRIHPNAIVIGKVELGDDVNVWPGTVLRGDCDWIRVGRGTNIQDNSVIHNEPGLPAIVGEDCVIGHQVCLHGCTIGDRCLIGIHATVLSGAIIGDECIIGAGALVTEGKNIPARSLVIGVPGKIVRQVTDEEAELIKHNSREYLNLAKDILPTV